MSLKLDYYYGDEADQFSFYRIPKALFTEPQYQGISVEAKVLYGLMLDRMALSMRNGWLDKKNKVFIYFKLDDVISLLRIKKDKAIRLFKELDIADGIGLIERIKQGQGRPAVIYVKKFVAPTLKPQTSEKTKSEVLYVDEIPAILPEVQIEGCNNSADLGSSEMQTSENTNSRVRETRGHDFGKTDSNNTEENNTEKSNSSLSIYPMQEQAELSNALSKKVDRKELVELYTKLVQENINYSFMLMRQSYEQDELDGMIELIVDTVTSTKTTIRIGKEDLPIDLVKSRFLKLEQGHIEYVLDSMKSITAKIHNIRAYMLTALYNASSTIGPYYTTLVNYHQNSQEDSG